MDFSKDIAKKIVKALILAEKPITEVDGIGQDVFRHHAACLNDEGLVVCGEFDKLTATYGSIIRLTLKGHESKYAPIKSSVQYGLSGCSQ